MRKGICLTVEIGALLLILLFAGACTVHADRPGYCTKLSIPVFYRTGWPDRGAVFSLESLAREAPMPEGTVDGRKVVRVKGSSRVDFGSILFRKPDTCLYRIRREDHGNGVDHSCYRVQVAALSDGNLVIVFEKEGQKEKPERIEYVDRTYKAIHPYKHVGVGNDEHDNKRDRDYDSRNRHDGESAHARIALWEHGPATGDPTALFTWVAVVIGMIGGLTTTIFLKARHFNNKWERREKS